MHTNNARVMSSSTATMLAWLHNWNCKTELRCGKRKRPGKVCVPNPIGLLSEEIETTTLFTIAKGRPFYPCLYTP